MLDGVCYRSKGLTSVLPLTRRPARDRYRVRYCRSGFRCRCARIIFRLRIRRLSQRGCRGRRAKLVSALLGSRRDAKRGEGNGGDSL